MTKKDEATQALKEMLKGASPAATTDIWTSNSNVSFISLTLHWIETTSNKWVYRNVTAACEVFDGSHSGLRVGAQVMGMFKELDIEKTVISVTSDMAANMKKAIEQHTADHIAWVGCGCHKTKRTVQKLVSQPVLKASLAVFSKAAAHLHKSSQSQEAFEQARKVRFPLKTPRKVPLGCVTRWWSWYDMLRICLEHKSSLVSSIEIANNRQGEAGITITYQDWTNAENLHRILEPFKEATEALEGDYITLPLAPCIMSVLNDHVESEISAFTPDSSLANATKVMLIDHSDRWNEIANVVKIAAALSARTKGLEWLDATEKALWRRSVIFECRKLFRADIAEEVRAGSTTNGPGSPDERGVGGGELPRKKKKSFLKRCGDGKGGGCGGRGGG